MITTAHSEYGILKKVFIKSAEAAFQSQSLINAQWKDLNYLDQPDYNIARLQYAYFESLLRNNNVEILYFSEDTSVTMDSMYCRDASIVTDHGVILCHMGKPQRCPESLACKADYMKHDFKDSGHR